MDTRTSISRKVLRSPNLRRKKNTVPVDQRVTLEKVLGLTIGSTAGLTCDPNTGAIAYPAGCVIIIFHPRRNKQSHIFNTSKKTITSVSFSGDGKYLVSGESGHQPAVRVWDVEEKVQVAQFHGHKFGINCVAYSPNMKYIVSIGTQHDMIVNVWNWRTNNKVASNKISSKVSAVAFSSDGSYFVTVGNRHVKFWYMANSNVKQKRVGSSINETVPLMGRSGILGEQKNNFFSDVACGKGAMADNTYTITQSGLLCEFNQKRLLDKWVELRAKNATGMAVGEEHVFIGCANGVIRVFDAQNLHFVASLPRPHPLGVDISAAVSISQICPKNDATYPDSMALTYDDINKKITCAYNDHSLYIWDVHDIKKVGKVWSSLYHSGCIWDLEIYPPEEELKTSPCLPPGSFITCSNDDTIRIWNIYQHITEIGPYKRNIYSHEILKTYYTDLSYAFLCDGDNTGGNTDKTDTKEGKNGIRSIKVSPDGQQLAAGDRTGNVRIYDLKEFTEIKTIEAHDAEVLALEYSPFGIEPRLLATASRDRLIHIFDIEQDYGLLQTLDDHSSSITAVKFTNNDGQFRMLSCSADKSLLFRNAQLHPEFQFTLHQHLVGKTTLYDMDVDQNEKFVATACQDRNVRIYNIKSAKLKKTYKGSVSEDGVLIKLQLDPSGSYIVTSCTDKNLSLFDFYTGELVASFYGHSEIATSIKFANDLKHLISVSGDGCIFIWRLSPHVTKQMQMRMEEKGNLPKESLNLSSIPIQRSPVTPMKPLRPLTLDSVDSNVDCQLRSVPGFLTSSPFNDRSHETASTGVQNMLLKNDSLEITSAGGSGFNSSTNPMDCRISIGQLPSWAKAKTDGLSITSSTEEPQSPTQPRGRWAQRIDNQPVRSLLDGNQNINMSEMKGYRQVAYNTDIVLEEDSSQSQVDSQVDSQSLSTHPAAAAAVGMVTAAAIAPGRNNSVISFDEQTDVADLEEDDEDFKPSQKNLDSKSGISGGTADSNSEKDGANLSFEMDDLDTDSDNSDLIYMPNNDDLESPENLASNFHVFASASKAIQIPKISSDRVKVNFDPSHNVVGSPELQAAVEDGDDEDTGDEIGPLSNANTPTDIEKEIFWKTPEKTFVKDNFESLSFSPAAGDRFMKNLDDLEQQMNDQLNSSTPRLSISTRFLSRAQPSGVKNLAIYNSIQRQENWYDLGWKGESLTSPESPNLHAKDSPAKYELIPAKLDFSNGSPKRTRISIDPTSPSTVKDRDIYERLSSGRERTLSGSSSGKGIDHPEFASLPVELTGDTWPRAILSLLELRIDESEEEVISPSSPTSKSLKTRLSLGNRKLRTDRNSLGLSNSRETSKSTSNLSRTQCSYSQQTKSSIAKINKMFSDSASSSPLKKEKFSSHSKGLQDIVKGSRDVKKKKSKKDLMSSNLSTCLSVPNLTCMESEEESIPSSNLRILCDLSLSQSVPEVNKMDDQASLSSRTTSSDPHSAPAQNSEDILDREPKMEISNQHYNNMSKRRVTIASTGDGLSMSETGNKSVKDSELMPPPLSTTVGSLKKDSGKRLLRGRRPQTELTLDQAKNILLGNSGLLGKSSYKITDRRKDSLSSMDTTDSEADARKSCGSSSAGSAPRHLNNYDAMERRSSTGKITTDLPERAQSPAITVKTIAAGLRNREIKQKSFLGDLAPSPNDPPERDSPSKYTSHAFNSSYHMNVGPSTLGAKSTVTYTLNSRSNIQTEPRWTKVPCSRASSGSGSSSNSWDGNSESGPKLLPSVKSKVALFDSPAAMKSCRRSLDKRNCVMTSSVDSSHTTAGSDTDTEMEIKRPDKSRSHSPASLITTNHSLTNSVALTTPTASPLDSLPVSPKADSSQLSLPIKPVAHSSQDIPSKAEKLEACKSVIQDLKLDVEKLTALYDKVADPEQQSQEILSLLGQVIQDTQQKVEGLDPNISTDPLPDRLSSMSTRDISTSPILFPDLTTETAAPSSSSVATATAVISTDDKGVNTSMSESEESPENDPNQLVETMVRLVERKLSSNLSDEVRGMLSTFFMSFLQIVIYKTTK